MRPELEQIDIPSPPAKKSMSAFKKGIYLTIAGAFVAGAISTIAYPQGAVTLVQLVLGAGTGGGLPVSSSNPLPVTGSFSSTISGFRPVAYGTPISVTTGGVTGTLPTNTGEVVATNVGTTNGAYCALGATATTADQYIAPNGGWFAFAISGDTQLTCITSTSTTTVNMAGGSGLPTGTGGGGGGGSSSNASVSATGSAVPASATYVGIISGGNLTGWTGGVTFNTTPSLANGNGVVPTQGGSTLSATNGIYSNILQGNAVLSATNGLYANILLGNAASATGAGATGATTQRVGVAQDTTTIAGSAPGTAGTASTQVVTVQGVASMTPVAGNITQVLGSAISATNGLYTNILQGNAALTASAALPVTISQNNTALGTPVAYGSTPTGNALSVNAFVTGATGTAQGATTSGITGSPIMAATTTANPSYTTAQTNLLSTDVKGNTRVVLGGGVPETISATGTTAATTATLATGASTTTYICGFSIRANATAAVTGNATVTGTITGTMNFTQWTAPAASGLGVTEEIFTPCIPASAANTTIAVVSAAPGSGGVVSVSAWGYQQ